MLCCGEPDGYTLGGRTIDHTNYDPASLSNADILEARSLDVYFEHASVGGYIVGPEPSWPSNGLADLAVLNSRYTCDRVTWSNTSIATWYDTYNGLGDNSRGNPAANFKISGFSSSINANSGLLPGKIDVAMYKFCYIDAPESSRWSTTYTADWLFATARTAMEALQTTYPDVVFVWWAMPIETTGETGRQAYNDLVRAYCSANDQWLFDIAAIESHNDAGVLQKDASNREILYSGYSADGGHPNDTGALKLAKAYWRLLAEIAKTR
jgi:hypothetical protein